MTPILSQMNTVQILTACFFNTHFNIILPSRPSFASGLVLSGFPSKMYVRACVCVCMYVCMYVSHISHACYMSSPNHPFWFDHPSNTWWREQIMELLTTQLCLHPLLSPNILLSTVFSNTRSLGSSLRSGIKFHTHANRQVKLICPLNAGRRT
jgi:hypothetical protein